MGKYRVLVVRRDTSPCEESLWDNTGYLLGTETNLLVKKSLWDHNEYLLCAEIHLLMKGVYGIILGTCCVLRYISL